MVPLSLRDPRDVGGFRTFENLAGCFHITCGLTAQPQLSSEQGFVEVVNAFIGLGRVGSGPHTASII